jgi:hypothetical protein
LQTQDLLLQTAGGTPRDLDQRRSGQEHEQATPDLRLIPLQRGLRQSFLQWEGRRMRIGEGGGAGAGGKRNRVPARRGLPVLAP